MLENNTQKKLAKAYLIFNVIGPLLLLFLGQASLVAVVYFISFLIFFFYRYGGNFYLFQIMTLLASIMITSCIGISIGSYNIYYCFILIIVYILFQLLNKKHSIYRQIKTLHIALILLFALFLTTSILFIAADKVDAIKGTVFWFAMAVALCIFFMEARYSSKQKELLFALCVLIIGVMALAVLEIIGIYLGLPSAYRTADINIFSSAIPNVTEQFTMHFPAVFFGNTNNFAIVALCAYCLCFCIFLFNDCRRIKIAALLGSCLSVFCMVFTTSVIGFACVLLTLAIGCIMVILRYFRDKRKMILCLCLAISTAAVVFLCMTPPLRSYYEEVQPFSAVQSIVQYLGPSEPGGEKKEPVLSALETKSGGNSIDVRMVLYYRIYLKIIKEGNFFGLGPGQAESYLQSQKIYHDDGGVEKYIYSPHSFLFELLGDFGLPGLIVYLALMLFLFVYACVCFLQKRGSPLYPLFCILIISGFFFGGFSPSTVKGFPFYFAVMGMAIGYLFYNSFSEASSEASSSEAGNNLLEDPV